MCFRWKKITSGLDTNNDGQLDAAEVKETNYICHGENGSANQSLVEIEEEPAGSFCSNGGQKITSGLDVNGDGVLDSDEIKSTSYACNGENAAETSNTLIRIDDEPAGEHCPDGGKKLSTGIDINGNGELDTDEVIKTDYICHGESTITYQTLVEIEKELPGEFCSNGGQKIMSGLDFNGDGVLDSTEVKNTSYACNGINATDAINSLISIRDEPEGVNCPAGGKKIATGLDSNANGKLDDNEILDSNFICHGEKGTDGAGANTEPRDYIVVHSKGGKPTSFNCPADAWHQDKTVARYFSATEGTTGTPYKACITESCNEYIPNGSRYRYFMSSGCNDHYNEARIECAIGYDWLDGHCQKECPIDTTKTSRGCEALIAQSTCSVEQEVKDNQCVNIAYVDVAENICGVYTNPIKIKAGAHFVTCPTIFHRQLFIEAGTTLQVDREWDISAEAGVRMNGTSANPITIKTSTNNPENHWGALKLAGSAELTLDGVMEGDFIRYANISGNKSGLKITGLVLDNASITTAGGTANIHSSIIFSGHVNNNAGHGITMHDSFVRNAEISVGSLTTRGSFVIGSTLPKLSPGRSFSNNIKLGLVANAILFNNLIEVSNCNADSWSFVQGNNTVVSQPSGTECIYSDNGKVSDKFAVYIKGEKSRVTDHSNAIRVETYVINKTGFVVNATVVWKARYDIDGTYYDSGSQWEGQAVDITLPYKESWEVYIESVNGEADILGPKSIYIDAH